MIQEKAMTVTEGNFIELRREPTEVLDDARKAAKALTSVIDQKPRKVMIKGQVYLEYEDWQTVAQFYGYTVRTCNATPVEFNGVKGAKAEAELIYFRSGMVVGGAEAYCMANEENWGNKPWFQLASMAQTRAGAKAIRNRMAWVVVMAGYAGTPAEEMIQEKIAQRREKSEHWCTVHNTEFFKKGKMKGYAHLIEDTKEWCNEEETEPKTSPQPTQSTSSPVVEESNAVPLKENLPSEAKREIEGLLKSLKVIRWTESTAKSWLRSQYHVDVTPPLKDVCAMLKTEQWLGFTNHIKSLEELK